MKKKESQYKPVKISRKWKHKHFDYLTKRAIENAKKGYKYRA